MEFTDEGLERIQQAADEQHNVKLILIVQLLIEIRELKELVQQGNNSTNGGNNSTSSTDDCKND